MLAEARRGACRADGVLLAFVPVEGERLSWYRLFRRVLGDDLYARTKGHVQAFTHAEVEVLIGEHFVIEDRVFSYHPLGQLMDAGLCAALSLGPVQRSFWAYSPFHGDETRPRGLVGARRRRGAAAGQRPGMGRVQRPASGQDRLGRRPPVRPAPCGSGVPRRGLARLCRS